MAIQSKKRNLCVRLVGLIDAFFFRPADPATLGLLRILCGLAVLYVHLSYTFDLQKLVGKDAWVGLDTANLLRMQTPIQLQPGDFEVPHLEPWPIDTEKRLWVQEYYLKYRIDPRRLPEHEPERSRSLAYIDNFGVDPRQNHAQGNVSWSIWFHLTDVRWMNVVHSCVLVCMFLFTIGLCTRVTSVLTWLTALFYVHRTPTTMFGQDAMMSVALFYLMLAPSGAAYSVDRLITWYRYRVRHSDRSGALPVEKSVSANFVLRLFQIHFAIIYFASGTAKLQGSSWWNGTALWGVMANPEFSPMHLDWYLAILRFLCEHRALWELVTSGGVIYTILLELGFPFLVWTSVMGDLLLDMKCDRRVGENNLEALPLETTLRHWFSMVRGVLVVGVVLLHAGIALNMGLVPFSCFMMLLVLPYIPSVTVRELFSSLSKSLAAMVTRGARPSASPYSALASPRTPSA